MKNFYLKRWHPERFVAVVKHLSQNMNLQVVIAGGNDESSLKQLIIRKSYLIPGKQIFDLSTNIQNTAAVIKKSRLVIANDSLVAHLAAAVGTYVITLFGPSDQDHTGPYTLRSSFICHRPATIKPYKHGSKNMSQQQGDCMNLITVEEVVREAEKVLCIGKVSDSHSSTLVID
jgi:ADP-heptose:LPS heptosyltransferase